MTDSLCPVVALVSLNVSRPSDFGDTVLTVNVSCVDEGSDDTRLVHDGSRRFEVGISH